MSSKPLDTKFQFVEVSDYEHIFKSETRYVMLIDGQPLGKPLTLVEATLIQDWLNDADLDYRYNYLD